MKDWQRQKLSQMLEKASKPTQPQRTTTTTMAKQKQKKKKTPINEKTPTQPPKSTTTNKQKLSMKEKLEGGRFRYLNELLYTKPSSESFEIFRNEPHLFDEYHRGFRNQVSKWPVNPLDVIEKRIEMLVPEITRNDKSSQEVIVADLGCGEAELALRLKSRGMSSVNVYSFDLVARNDRIIAANIKNVPLPNERVHIAVFCLSLMGTDYQDFISEAKRILKPGGYLIIAEVESRLPPDFATAISEFGFALKRPKNLDIERMFRLFEFQKEGNNISKSDKKQKKLAPVLPPLKPCLYKKR